MTEIVRAIEQFSSLSSFQRMYSSSSACLVPPVMIYSQQVQYSNHRAGSPVENNAERHRPAAYFASVRCHIDEMPERLVLAAGMIATVQIGSALESAAPGAPR
jgi:hypothetical protein